MQSWRSLPREVYEMGYVYARLIHKGLKTINDVPVRYQEATREAYLELYGEVI